jgi:NAD(P)-dependent dehydrogenase (short-subunit alcohol dehydrogenase family)
MNKYTFNELKVGQHESHSYFVAPEFTQLLERYELQTAPVLALAILWSSFLIGMRFPGESALYSGADFIFYQDHIGDLSALKYNLEIVGLDERFQLVELKATLWSGTTLLTSAELRCFVRQTTEPQKQFVAAPNARLLGKVALVTGASRGLGRALTLALAQEGAFVYANFRQSVEEAQELLALAPNGQVILSKGNAGDLDYCTQAIATIVRENKQLDFLFCNAAPAILPFWIEENTFARIQSFMSQSFALIHAPFSAALPKLSPGGKVVVLSSSALINPPAEWPHYAAAKAAWEEFTRVAQKQYPKLSFYIARPPKLATDLTNTPTGWQDAQEPEVVAKLIVEAIIKQPLSNPETLELT